MTLRFLWLALLFSLSFGMAGVIALPENPPPSILELTFTQGSLDALTALGLEQVSLAAIVEGVTISLSDLKLTLPTSEPTSAQPWSVTGKFALGYGENKTWAASNFLVSAQPVIEKNRLKLRPDWSNLQLEGRLPFAFLLGTSQLGQYAKYLPQTVPIFDLSLVNRRLASKVAMPEIEDAQWFLSTPSPGLAHLALSGEKPTQSPVERLAPGLFRLTLGDRLVDRLVKQEVKKRFNKKEPIRPQPPIQVGKALFIPILVKSVYIRNLEASYSDQAFRFRDLIIDVGWSAGPISGTEPLLEATGSIVPRIAEDKDGAFLSWSVDFSKLVIKSDKVPGNKDTLSVELTPKIEQLLGPELANKERISNVVELRNFVPVESGQLRVTRFEPRSNRLILEGALNLKSP